MLCALEHEIVTDQFSFLFVSYHCRQREKRHVKSWSDIIQLLEKVPVTFSTLSFTIPKSAEWFIFTHDVCFPA